VPHEPGGAAAADQSDACVIQYGELNNHLGYFVRRAQHWIFRDANARLELLRLDVIRYSILEMISSNPGISQILLSGALGIERARLVALLDELQHSHFIVRHRSKIDRRSHELQLTPEGRTVLEQANKLIAAHEEKVMQRIGLMYPDVRSALSTFLSG
jgi:DNA-binding MarR family transcriptional regulator